MIGDQTAVGPSSGILDASFAPSLVWQYKEGFLSSSSGSVEKQTSQQVAKNHLWLKTTIDAVKWLTFQACAFRGCDVSHDSNNRGNVIEWIKLLAFYNANVADVVLHKAPHNASYYSRQIQKEILSIFFDKIQRFVCEEIDEAKCCIIVDKAGDESKKEQMAIVLRFVDKDGFIKERFFDIVHVSDTTSATLCRRAPEEDSSSSALRRHDQLKVAQVKEIVAKLAIEEIEIGKGNNQVGTLKRVEDTRWGSHLGSISNLINMFSATCSILSNVINDGITSTQRVDADRVYDKITSFEFVFILQLMRDIMGTIDDLCQALQRKSHDILNAIHLVSTTKELTQKYRKDGWILLLENVQLFCEKYDIDNPDMSARYTSGRCCSCHQRDHITIENHFRVDIFTIICDSHLQELNNRFREDVMELLILSFALDPRDDYSSFKLKIYASLKINFILMTLQISTATTERAFSAMKIINTRLRSSMENDFLLTYVEKDIA
ncbi:uncharacterized protein LOC114279217 [Camellia sinensis]|uniref:uncharacterized protein LOC114279217 n=1 Tax=Camellia sinensis TaxID=4442 RepID=UPI001035F709|nr:uncharacterized protein LOC114279217 [Camellia sinensis]